MPCVLADVTDSERVFMYNVGPEEPFKDGTTATQTAFATSFTSQVCLEHQQQYQWVWLPRHAVCYGWTRGVLVMLGISLVAK
jgi:hypothetical protein